MGWNRNFLIDGFPRNKENNDVWKELMDSLVDFQFVLYIDCTFETMKERI